MGPVSDKRVRERLGPMRGRTRRTAAAGAAAFVLAGSATFAASSGTAYADTVTAKCGDTVTAKPGDQITTPFGLQTVTDGVTSLVGGLLGGLCKITVNVVDTAVAPVPVVGPPAAGTLNDAVSSTTSGVGKAISDVASPRPPDQGTPGDATPPPDAPRPEPPTTAPAPDNPGQAPVSPPVLPFESYGYAPALDYSDLPYGFAALWSPTPALRYGDGIPGAGPAPAGLGVTRPAVQNAGQAYALAPASEQTPFSLGVPALAAVLAVSAVSAGLVRAWVQRGSR